jgi:hypothetical protein
VKLRELLIAFAATGEVGPLKLGMAAEEADRLLGGGTGLCGPATDPSGSVGFKDGSLELWAGPEATLLMLGFDDLDATGQFQTPARLTTAVRGERTALTRGRMLDSLDELGCRWHTDDALTFDGQLAVRTEAGVFVVFARADPPPGEWVLSSLYKAAPAP